MKKSVLCLILLLTGAPAAFAGETEERNKALARRFYEEVWFKNSPPVLGGVDAASADGVVETDVVDELFASTYVAHDIGTRKNVTEPAEEQKRIAEFFWQNGTMSGSIDYQIAEGDLVATRWQWQFDPSAWWMKALGGRQQIPIINVFRFKDGKIVEVWNHRHDIDTFQANFIFLKGLAIGLVPSVVLLTLMLILWRRHRNLKRLANAR